MLKHGEIKVLLIQVRKDTVMQAQERQAICRSGRILPNNLTVVNGLKHSMSTRDLSDYHMLIIGGTGDYSIFEPLPITNSLATILHHTKRINFPVLGSCWGGQLMAEVFGGKVEKAESSAELGSYQIHPTSNAQTDLLFNDTPQTFWAQLGHNESITRLPKKAINLLSSAKCRFQAFTWPGSSMYGLQLHSDLSKEELEERVTHYRANYAAEQTAFDRFIASLQDSPYTDYLIAKYIDRIVLPLWNKA